VRAWGRRDDRPVEREPIVYRTEVMAILGALADLVVEVREIRRFLWEEDDEEEDAEEP
jgi:hypothetical protein